MIYITNDKIKKKIPLSRHISRVDLQFGRFDKYLNTNTLIMDIVIINGSLRIGSFNQSLVCYIQKLSPTQNIEFFDISALPLFQDRKNPRVQAVTDWKAIIKSSNALIVTSPEYLFNIPAALKNAFEWLNEDSLLAQKKVLPIIATPQEPRGEKAMQSLLWTLQSLHADIQPSLSLYHTDFTSVNDPLEANTETLQILEVCLESLF